MNMNMNILKHEYEYEYFVHVFMSGDTALTHSMLGKDQSVKIIIFIVSIISPPLNIKADW